MQQDNIIAYHAFIAILSNAISSFILVLFLFQSTIAKIIPSGQILYLPKTPYNYSIASLPLHLKSFADKTRPALNPEIIRENHLATLGRVLFYDKTLSRNNLVSCASCHSQASAFDDPVQFSIGFEGKITRRNSMGLVNISFSSDGQFFWDNRAANLGEQVLMPFFDAIEMGLKDGQLILRVRANTYYKKLFANAFGEEDVSKKKIAAALSKFVISIISLNSTYDRARQAVNSPWQDFPAFTAKQNRGKFLFLSPVENGGAGCVLCHQSETFNFQSSGSNNGLDIQTDKDQGIGEITGNSKDMGNFNPPSLRNIAFRAPYMHDGRFVRLEQVIDHYSTQIKNHPNLDPILKDKNNQPRKLNFSSGDKEALVGFLETLSDHQLLNDPKFSNPFR